MQTFLPYESFLETAKCLDYRRLGKQRVEALQILNTLLRSSNGWRNHPAVKMWEGFEGCLAVYGLVICREWVERGYRDNCADRITELVGTEITRPDPPPWVGDRRFHRSHQSNLLRKDPEFYGKYNWNVPNGLPYIWPK